MIGGGIDPLAYTWWELATMAEFARRGRWEVASELMALVGNCHRKAHAKPFSGRDFSPFSAQESRTKKKRAPINKRLFRQIKAAWNYGTSRRDSKNAS